MSGNSTPRPARGRRRDRAMRFDSRARTLAAVFFTVALGACFVFGPDTRPVTGDNQTFFYMAERAASGVPPHVSNINHKNALSVLLSGAAIAVGRAGGTGDVRPARALTMMLTAATVAMVYLLALALTRDRAAAFLAALVMLGFADFLGQGAVGFRPKTFMAFFMVAALLAATTRRTAMAAALATMSFLCWQPAGVVLAALAAEAWGDDDRRGRLAAIAAGACIPLLAYQAYFVWHGAVGTQIYQEYFMATDTGGHRFPGLGETLSFILRMGHEGWDSSDVIPVFLLVGIAWLAASALFGRSRLPARMSERPGLLATAVTATGAVVFTFIDHQAWPDLFFIQAFVAIAAGAGIMAIVAHFIEESDTPRRSLAVAVVALLLATTAVQRVNGFSRTRSSLAEQYDLVRQVDVLREDHGSVWVIGCLHLLALARQENHVPIGILIDPRVRAYARSLAENGEYEPLDAEGRMPGVILASRGGEPRVIPWLRKRYRRVTNDSFDAHHIRIWVERDPADEQAERARKTRGAGLDPL